ncbi:alkaline phosphatase D family protein [Halegenticoccus soli]|uniref:alkaline phosphatase D family protein n=1 Tax=Halegenticoccus soli TaxID=1985678 RepID=UPI000C6D3284|nr:alkaline phosphatase D family protein [Halegenticoccus soli]
MDEEPTDSPSEPRRRGRHGRRAFLKKAVATSAGASTTAGCAAVPDELLPRKRDRESRLTPVAKLPDDVTRPWIGPQFWSNRLQDWRLHAGRIECLRGGASYEVRTVSVLTREIVPGRLRGHLRVTTGLAGHPERDGFCGFLIGVGDRDLDYRAAALAQRGSGEGGGFLCAFERDGRLRFREHTNEVEPLEFGDLPAEARYPDGEPTRPAADDRVRLDLEVLPRGDDRFDVRLTARDAANGEHLGTAIRRDVAEAAVTGGIALVSSPPAERPGARWWFRNFRTGGGKVAEYPKRTFGPIAGALYTVNENVLRLSAQLAPIADDEVRRLRLDYRPAGTADSWRRGPTDEVRPGYAALFRLDDWDPTRAWEYRVVYRSRTGASDTYRGRIREDPGAGGGKSPGSGGVADSGSGGVADSGIGDDSRNEGESNSRNGGENDPRNGVEDFKIGLFSCTAPTARGLEAGGVDPKTSEDARLGRYTRDNLYFPYPDLVRNARRQDPDFLVFAGDQLYQNNPTRVEGRENPTLDYLYKWYLWVWAFRSLTRTRPTAILVDDHDVYQQNLWGEKGKSAARNVSREGGYVGTTDFVNLVQRTQCSHNPDPYDPTPVKRGIDVYYASFRYGGVDFALLEDRKFKSDPPSGDGERDADESERLLGSRQKRFLREWIEDLDEDAVPICLSQSLYACVETAPDGSPATDLDSNGYPPEGRDDAVRLFREAGALVLSGDRHLATLVRHGIDGHADGAFEFSGPASASLYQRWFNPRPQSDDPSDPTLGEFVDTFGNRVRVHAAANPRLTFEAYRRRRERGQAIGNRELKREGYGLVRIDRENEQCLIECWPWNGDPTDAAEQFPGWPFELPFEEFGSGSG